MCSLSCLSSSDYRDVYEPNEDTYLLIDALNLEAQGFLKEKDPGTILEIGVGSGAVITSFYMLLSKFDHPMQKLTFFGTDINTKALDCAKRVSEINQAKVEFRECEFADESFADKSVSIVIFNPPYVVTSEEELKEAQEKKAIAASWAGGS